MAKNKPDYVCGYDDTGSGAIVAFGVLFIIVAIIIIASAKNNQPEIEDSHDTYCEMRVEDQSNTERMK